MNLTVAMKIIGGFTIISILLILTSVISLLNLNTISDSTQQQNQLAIPTLKGSNKLALALEKMESSTLRGFYQTDLDLLAENLNRYRAINAQFMPEFKQLEALVQNENELMGNLNQVSQVFSSLEKNALSVFSNRKISIEQSMLLKEKVSDLEDKADDAVTLLLDLADHRLAETKLQRAISLSEQLENQFNAIVSSSLEYRDINSDSTADLIESEISFSLEGAQSSVNEIIAELTMNNMESIAEELSDAFSELEELLSSDAGTIFHKKSQLTANHEAKAMLAALEQDTIHANKILDTQVELANQATLASGKLVKSSVESGNKQTIIIAIVSIIIAFVIARFTLLSITRPLSRVNDMLNIVSSGDLSRKLDETGKDEFALLAKNCNVLIDSLRSLIEGIVNRSAQLAAAAEETSTVTAESTVAIEEQRNQVEQAATATTEMSSTAKSVLSSANDALNEIKHADDEAERVKTISGRNRETIEQLATEVDSAAHVINQLQQDSASIGGILDVIRAIADQTNLLALNAAIEAARAGEHGRGFAVVADEVRTLASRTQESTAEIHTMIESLQSGAEKAVSVMDTGKAKASDCVTQSKEADRALETITHAVHEAYDRSSQIATAAEEQNVVAHEISENLESIVAIAEQTTAGSQQTAASSSEVARLSEELQQSVQEFKL
ncbi:methyl-accepting chemotaxis protein [Colwellia sp. 4_MG-2023]|uniref:HAMP domain-containing methyl-accepting chemotaxis protein n=1 Tax=unclassified Colwellia TaxID=196834 RepID=UPI001C097701|nr:MULTISPECIES: methyl-accepting chemotaxis protein [unclassified Colwellia]MBU2925042.1 methyl-accepting chemotaxis protein [Colwellia sp. C2M11]MDO6506325.1 methyl-accepting chemotaxis protein [Colwellia sp. 5_MG-2023]MDO6555149.1 methyl-accepting chemotaxis protein [Colwellia sp. 4_MG-2023]MDO6651665.1 methyl-accepting chemotaxis protein [Colwellia sp. 3_MG-2023]MDO6664937.1 methyl-accepting chemotaxis protein [Colwellia sp. 2_MG-2023]